MLFKSLSNTTGRIVHVIISYAQIDIPNLFIFLAFRTLHEVLFYKLSHCIFELCNDFVLYTLLYNKLCLNISSRKKKF